MIPLRPSTLSAPSSIASLEIMAILPGFLEGNLPSLASKAGAVFVVYWVIWLVYAKTLHPLAKVPGPLWPSLSRTWLMTRMYYGDYHLAQVALHDKYALKPFCEASC